VSLSCVVSSTLTGTTCSVSPTSVAPGGTATLTVTASPLAGMRHLNPLFSRPSGWMGAFVFAVGLLLTRTKPAATRRPRSGRWDAMLMLLLIGTLTVTTSCGGGSSGGQQASPPGPQSGTVTVQASSGALNHNVLIAVTVNQ
ncbi:MAG: hypothetical protein WCC92_14860, partial [Candidatus Korobacteraceae bacterium]